MTAPARRPDIETDRPTRAIDLRPLKRQGVTDGMVLAITGALCLVFGLIALAYNESLDSAVHDFKSAAPCRTGIQDTNCYEQRGIDITGVGTGRMGEVNAADFIDNGQPHEVGLRLGGRDPSVLRAGASGTATLWHGSYTNLDVGGIDFVTDENPVGRQGLWLIFAVIGIGFALILWAASLAWNVMNERGLSSAPADPPSIATLP